VDPSPSRREGADPLTGAANARSQEERYFLEGPRPRGRELWFLLRIMGEFFKGFRALHRVGPCVTVFGSARFGETSPYYLLARQVGRRLAEMGFTVMTGGGPGLMEAANRGAKDVGGRSVACNIQLQREEANPYLDTSVTFRYFFVRKVLLLKYSYAFVVLPGGWGTMDELFETLTLIQTRKIHNFPLVMMGTDYWAPLTEMLARMAKEGTIDVADLELLLLTDSVDEAAAHIETYAVQQFGLRRRLLAKSGAPAPVPEVATLLGSDLPATKKP
jgi:uncharacterized protein (TIGR00730 family)